MKIKALGPHDADSIMELALDYYPEELQLDTQDITDALNSAVEEGGNFSAGLIDQGQLMAYMLAWLEDSRLEGRPESVILIDDLVMAYDPISDLRMLITYLVGQLQEQDLHHLAIEGCLLPDTRAIFQKQQDFFASLGYEMVASQEYWEEALATELTWVRYERPLEVEISSTDQWDGVEFSD